MDPSLLDNVIVPTNVDSIECVWLGCCSELEDIWLIGQDDDVETQIGVLISDQEVRGESGLLVF